MTTTESGLTKPKKVTIAVNLLLISLAIRVIYTFIVGTRKAMHHEYKDQFESLPLQIAMQLLLVLVLFFVAFFLISQIGHRKKWARGLVLLNTIASFLAFIFIMFISKLTNDLFSPPIITMQFVVLTISTILLYWKDSNRWFNGEPEA